MPKPRLRDTWILRKQEAITFGILFVGMSAIWFAFGWLLTHPLKDSWIVRTDESIAKWFVDQRTPTLNSLSFIGSMLSDTLVKIVVTAIAAVVMLKVWKRWLEPLVVCMSLILEALCFITVTTLVGRPRPDVEHLDTSPVGSSYPSGHTAAAVAYSAIIVVLFWHIRTRWIRALLVVLGAIIPVCVGLARMYRGMHFLSDVVMGALLGGASVIATTVVLRRAAARHEVEEHQHDGELPAPTIDYAHS